jgi:hypothetical protein
MMVKAATEPNSYRGNLRSGGFPEFDPIGLTMEASVSPRPLLVIRAERTGLIAKKGPVPAQNLIRADSLVVSLVWR